MSEGPGPASSLLADLPEDERVRARAAFLGLAERMGLDLGDTFDRLQAGLSLAQALDLPAGTAAVLYDRAYGFVVAGRTDRALPIFRALCLIEPDEAKNWLGLGIAQSREGDLAGAREALERAVAAAATWAVVHFHLADRHVRAQDWPAAAEALARFDRLPKADVPNRMLQDAERLRLAIDVGLRRAAAGGATP